jgi:hypothetical protein
MKLFDQNPPVDIRKQVEWLTRKQSLGTARQVRYKHLPTP